MPEMFGAPAGIDAAQQSQALAGQMQGQQIQNQQQALALKQSQQMYELAQQYRSQVGAPSQPGASPLDGPTMLEQMGDMYIRSGLVKQGGDMLEKAALIRSHIGTSTKATIEAQMKEFGEFAGLLDTVTDQRSLDMANMYWMQTHKGQPSPLAGVAYTPDVIARAKDMAVSAKDRAATTASRAATELRNAEKEIIPAKKAHLDAVTKLANVRTSALVKAGATGVVAKPADIKKAADMVLTDYPSMRPEEARTVGQRMAERANELVASNKGLTQSQAMTRAYHEEKLTGGFAGARRPPPRAAPPPVAGATQKGKGWVLPPGVAKAYGVPSGTLAMPGQFIDKESGMVWIGGPMNDPSSWEYDEDATEEAE